MKKRWILFAAAVWAICSLVGCGQTDGRAEAQAEEQSRQDAQMQDSGQPEAEAETDSRAQEPAGSQEGTQTEGQTQQSEDGQIGTASDSQAQGMEENQNSTYTFTDDLGREVTVDSPERVASLLGSYADMWVLAGGSVCAAPEDAFDDFDLGLSEDVVNLGETKKLSLELLLGADPDFVLASTNTQQHLEWQQSLEGAGITVAYFDVACFEDYLRVLKICTDITGQPERYEQYGTDIQSEINEILEKYKTEEPKTVLFMRASATSIRAKGNQGNVLGEMLESFGCVNIADTDDSLLENLSLESILLLNPDRILIVQSGDDIEGTRENVEAMFRENPLWNEMDAVRNGQVHILDKHLYNLKPNARWAEAVEKLAEILYGE